MPSLTPTIPLANVLRDRRVRAWRREKQQTELFSTRKLHKDTIAAKLIGIASGKQMDNFQRCGEEPWVSVCRNCGREEKFFYNCNRKWCPLCNSRLARLRAEKLSLWAGTIKQPKHLVLTMRNFPVLTRREIRRFQKALLALRRRQVFSEVLGGCCSMEITNQGASWHLHAHLLLDVRWLDMTKLAIEWGKLLGQEFGIVKVKDCRGVDYLNEVSKYVAKGSELATWSPEQLWEFICAIRGCRFFFAFGSLFDMRRQIAAELHARKQQRPPCQCGCCEVVAMTEVDAELRSCTERVKWWKRGR